MSKTKERAPFSPPITSIFICSNLLHSNTLCLEDVVIMATICLFTNWMFSESHQFHSVRMRGFQGGQNGGLEVWGESGTMVAVVHHDNVTL